MRKKTISNIAVKLLWLILLMLPFLFICISLIQAHDLSIFNLVASQTWALNTNIVYQTLVDTFGSNGLIPLFADDSFIFLWINYYVCLLLARMVVDVLTFIPKWSHKLMNSWGGDELE